MNEKEKKEYLHKFDNQLHLLGRITAAISVILMVATPLVIAQMYGVSISGSGFLNGFLKVGVIYIPVAIVEFLVYAPMLGTGGSYLSFLTGNVTNLKIPCAMNARDIAKTTQGTVEDEIVSTLSVATSALVTMVILFLGVLLLVPLTPILQNPVLEPAFNNVVPALFGALGCKYFAKSWKLTAIPLLSMILLCVLVPAMIDQTSILLLPAGGMALAIGFLMYKKGIL